jgi:hypothetical protein
MIIFGILILAFCVATPFYLGALGFHYWRKKKWPGLLSWILHPLLALVWLFTTIAAVRGLVAATPAPSGDQTAAANPAAPDGTTRTLNLPGWSSTADGNTWLQDSEAEKQQFCSSAAIASTNQHTAAFFYTNLNSSYDPTKVQGLKVPLIARFLQLDATGPADSYPSFQGFSWKRMSLVKTSKGDAQMIAVFWPDGHTFLHNQGVQSGSFTEAGPDGPWDGDLFTYAGTTTISGNTFTITIPHSNPPTQTGTFQVSADKQELDMTEGGRTPVRYTEVAQLVNSIDDL